MTASLHILPRRYLIAWSDGETEGIVEGWDTRKLWEAEVRVFELAEQYTGRIFWIIECGNTRDQIGGWE